MGEHTDIIGGEDPLQLSLLDDFEAAFVKPQQRRCKDSEGRTNTSLSQGLSRTESFRFWRIEPNTDAASDPAAQMTQITAYRNYCFVTEQSLESAASARCRGPRSDPSGVTKRRKCLSCCLHGWTGTAALPGR